MRTRIRGRSFSLSPSPLPSPPSLPPPRKRHASLCPGKCQWGESSTLTDSRSVFKPGRRNNVLSHVSEAGCHAQWEVNRRCWGPSPYSAKSFFLESPQGCSAAASPGLCLSPIVLALFFLPLMHIRCHIPLTLPSSVLTLTPSGALSQSYRLPLRRVVLACLLAFFLKSCVKLSLIERSFPAFFTLAQD